MQLLQKAKLVNAKPRYSVQDMQNHTEATE